MAAERLGLERLRYWQGQMLRSRDFRDQAAMAAELRRWHNRALHNAFGVVAGLVATGPAAASAPSVTVSAGLAYDATGRPLALPRPTSIAVPDSLDPVTLVLRAAGGATGRGGERAELVWTPTRTVTVADGVPLARLRSNQGRWAADPSFSVPVMRRLARPGIARGATIPGQTAWEVWDALREQVGPGVAPRLATVVSQGPVLAFQVRIDTTAAGFTEPPLYFAQLRGALAVPGDPPSARATAWTHVANASITGFTFRMFLVVGRGSPRSVGARPPILLGAELLEFLRRQSVFVSWHGIEPGPARAAIGPNAAR